MSLFLTAVISLSGAVQAATPETPLKFFSSDVDVIIRLQEPDRTLEKVVGLVNKVQPGAGEALKAQQTAALGSLISNPTLTGVDLSRDWYAGAYFRNEEAPMVVFAIPAINPDDVVGALGDMTTRVEGKWVLYTDAGEIPKADSSSSAASRLGESHTKSLLSGDLNFYVNADHVTEVYADQLEVAQDQVLENLNQLRFLPNQGSINSEAIVEIYGSLAEALFQSLEDAQISMASISITEDELIFNKQVTFAEDSTSSQFLAANPPDAMAELSRLPGGAQMYYGMCGAMKQLTKAGLKMSLAISNNKDANKKLEETLALLDPVTMGPMVASMTISPVEEPAFRAAAIAVATPIEQIKKFNRKMAEAMGTMENESMKQTSTLKVDAETFGSHQIDVLELKQEIKPGTPTSEMQKKMQNLMFGGDTMETRTAYLDKQYTYTMGGGENAMKELLDGLESGKTNALPKYREQLMKEANLLLFIDLARFSADTLVVTANQIEGFPFPINAQMIDSLNLKSSFISMAAGSGPNTARFEFRLPVDQVIGLTKLGILVGTSIQQGL